VKLAIGTAQFGMTYGIANQLGQVTAADASAIIDLARSFGIDTIDTAVDYGASETTLGNVGVKDSRIITKIPSLGESTVNADLVIRQHVLQSLNNLQIPKLDGLLLHRPDELLTPMGPALWRALNAVKDEGLVQKVGYSIYSPSQLDTIYRLYPADIVQAPYNIIDRRICSSGWLDTLNADGVEVHVRSVFLQGLLLMDSHTRPKKFSEWSTLWASWERWLQQNGCSRLEATIMFALSNKNISRVVVGVDSVHQLNEIIEATKRNFDLTWPPELSSGCERLINPANWNSL
jgi:aryl-alcohol dehydrogenase-like predicted oxidoreductase